MKAAFLIGVILFVLSATCNAEESYADYKFLKGTVSGFEGRGFVLNERHKVVVTHETSFYDASGNETASYNLEPQKRIYVEGVPYPDGSVEAEKVYILPAGREGNKRYDFMQSP
jgi:hypothetical protein